MGSERNHVDPVVAEERGLRQYADAYKDYHLMPEAAFTPPTWILISRLAKIILKLLDRLEDQRKGAANGVQNESIKHP